MNKQHTFYLKITPPEIEKEQNLITQLNKFFNNLPVKIIKEIFNIGEPIIFAGNDEQFLKFLVQNVIDDYNYEILYNINLDSLEQKRILTVTHPENPKLYITMFLYIYKKTTELISIKQEIINIQSYNTTESLELYNCKCGNSTPIKPKFCIYCGENLSFSSEEKYSLKINRFLDKDIVRTKMKIKKFLSDLIPTLKIHELENIINPPFLLTFISSKETAQMIKKELESYGLECNWKAQDTEIGILGDIVKFISNPIKKNYFLGEIKDRGTVFKPLTIQVIKESIKNIRSSIIKQILISCLMETIGIIDTITSSIDKTTNILSEDIVDGVEKLLHRICKLLLKGDQIDNYLSCISPQKIEREMEKLIYQIEHTNDPITKETYIQAIKTKEKELERFKSLKIASERLQAQIINVVTSFSSLKTEVTHLILIDTGYSKGEIAETINMIKSLQDKVSSIEEVMHISLAE